MTNEALLSSDPAESASGHMTTEALLSSANRDPERSPARRPRGLPCYDPPRPENCCLQKSVSSVMGVDMWPTYAHQEKMQKKTHNKPGAEEEKTFLLFTTIEL
ncbi:uncharacterized protein LOC144648425 [Oculina patagonica]